MFFDAGLSMLADEWAGNGRQWGWMLGAVVTAIGLPLGWVHPQHTSFLFFVLFFPTSLVVDVHAFFALTGGLHHRAIRVYDRFLEELGALLLPHL